MAQSNNYTFKCGKPLSIKKLLKKKRATCRCPNVVKEKEDEKIYDCFNGFVGF